MGAPTCRDAMLGASLQSPLFPCQPTPNGGGLGIVVAGSLAGAGLVPFSGWPLDWVVLGQV